MIEELIQLHVQGARDLLQRFYGGNSVPILHSRDITTKHSCALFQVALRELLFLTSGANATAEVHGFCPCGETLPHPKSFEQRKLNTVKMLSSERNFGPNVVTFYDWQNCWCSRSYLTEFREASIRVRSCFQPEAAAHFRNGDAGISEGGTLILT